MGINPYKQHKGLNTMTNEQASKLTAAMIEIQNPLTTGFASILTAETEYSPGLIIKFFHYWEDFTRGTWDGYLTFSHDCTDDDITTGLLFCEDSITDRMYDFINEIVPIELERLQNENERLIHELQSIKADLGIRDK